MAIEIAISRRLPKRFANLIDDDDECGRSGRRVACARELLDKVMIVVVYGLY